MPFIALAVPSTAFAAGGTEVTVRVEGLYRALLLPTVVRVHKGWITRYGAPRGDCPAKSAQGALNVATHRRWHGVWTSQFTEYEITSILGEKHSFSSRYFWEIFTDDVAASAGACELKLHKGEQVLFAAVPQAGAAYPTAITAPHDVAAGQPFSVKVVWFDGAGKPQPLRGAHVSGGGMSATTNQSGVATLTATQPGTLILHARHRWSAITAYVRAAPVTVHVS